VFSSAHFTAKHLPDYLGAALDLTGTDINLAQTVREAIGHDGKGPTNPVDPYGPTDLAAGGAGLANSAVGTVYASKGGEAAWHRAAELSSRPKLPPKQVSKQLGVLKGLNKGGLRAFARALPIISYVLEGVDAGYSAYNCIENNRR
jgi:hypothetical protein